MLRCKGELHMVEGTRTDKRCFDTCWDQNC